MGGGFLREYIIEDEYGYVDDDYYGSGYGDEEYVEEGEYGDNLLYSDYGGQGTETGPPVKEDYSADYIREEKRRHRRRRRQVSTNETISYDYEYSVTENATTLQTNKTWIFNGSVWEEKAPMSIPRDRAACSIVNMPDGEVL